MQQQKLFESNLFSVCHMNNRKQTCHCAGCDGCGDKPPHFLDKAVWDWCIQRKSMWANTDEIWHRTPT